MTDSVDLVELFPRSTTEDSALLLAPFLLFPLRLLLFTRSRSILRSKL